MTNPEGKASRQRFVSAYSRPDLHKSLRQTAKTLIPCLALFYISMRTVE
ncbi:MAG: hypothetical protein QY332_04030 [Anaerolineales bacterium]|nr:MAG: hypothetical protein QY332_04030 [Anaerolineales bacterium]